MKNFVIFVLKNNMSREYLAFTVCSSTVDRTRERNISKIRIQKSTEFKNNFQNLLQNLSFELNSFII